MVRRLIAAASGLLLAVSVPAFAFAAEGQTEFEAHGRSLDPSTDWTMIMILTTLALLGLFAVTTIGFMYRRERKLDWEFQKPDAPHDDHH